MMSTYPRWFGPGLSVSNVTALIVFPRVRLITSKLVDVVKMTMMMFL